MLSGWWWIAARRTGDRLYLFAYLAMNLAPFAVIVASERANPEIGDDIAGLSGLARRSPWLAGR